MEKRILFLVLVRQRTWSKILYCLQKAGSCFDKIVVVSFFKVFRAKVNSVRFGEKDNFVPLFKIGAKQSVWKLKANYSTLQKVTILRVRTFEPKSDKLEHKMSPHQQVSQRPTQPSRKWDRTFRKFLRGR